jgi:hypothetical protein
MAEEQELKPLKVDRTKLITQTKYAQKEGLSKQNVYAMIKAGKIPVVKIEGATLVLLP